MKLTNKSFRVLNSLRKCPNASQREISEKTGLSLGSVNAAVKELSESCLIADGSITERGLKALTPYRVHNAVIMAAGMSSRFAPISYERPKGVLKVRDEVLIERQIRQLQEAGINDITVVVGYMKESFFYLEDLLGVKIRVNEEYASRNNNSTLMLVRDILTNTYICSSDDYFTENPFEEYVYKAYYAAQYFEGETDEYCLTCGAGNRITGIQVGGHDAFAMLGHVYFDKAFSDTFIRILEDEYDRPETASKLWEDMYSDHVRELDMVMRPYGHGIIYEFDSLDEVREFDAGFIENVDSSILDNICNVLSCSRDEITGIVPIKQGLTNLSCKFSCKSVDYVYRHPGFGTDEIICRASEAYSQEVARDLGIDETFIFEDPQTGWKISRFIEGCVPFDYHNEDHVIRGLSLARKLHRCGRTSEWNFDVYEKAKEIVALLGARQYPSFPDFPVLADRAARLAELVRADCVEPCLCHNDFYAPNFLVRDDLMYLIDWEYSAMSDYASDLGTFICCSDYDMDEAARVVGLYFGRTPSSEELRHCFAYVSISAYYWFVWALYKESEGDPVGEWLYLWYRYAKTYGVKALELYNC